MHVTGLSRTDLIAHPEHTLTEEQIRQYERLVARRKRSEPIQYILGEREFYGLRFVVTPDVLIPRPETELLVEAALEHIPDEKPASLADVGTGSGAIAVALAHYRPMAKIAALDVSPSALELARRNAAAHAVGDRIRLLQSDLLEAVAGEQFDVIVSNPPYIADGDRDSLEAQVRDHEPAIALFAGPTGLEVYERLIIQAETRLKPGGWLMMEIGAGQHLQLRQLLNRWQDVTFRDDLQGIARVALARRA
nr:peptide chain release factor N(5)-glutamine methyltransferase [Acidisarcina polymorpha]